MKKETLFTFALFFISTAAFSQNQSTITDRYQTPLDIPSNVERYKVDYEVIIVTKK